MKKWSEVKCGVEQLQLCHRGRYNNEKEQQQEYTRYLIINNTSYIDSLLHNY